MMTEYKRSDDLVRIVNVGEIEIRTQYDSANYDFNSKEEKVVKREIAEHLVKKSYSHDCQKYSLKIIELPFDQRQKSPGEFPNLLQSHKKLEGEKISLEEQLKRANEKIAEMEKEKKGRR